MSFTLNQALRPVTCAALALAAVLAGTGAATAAEPFPSKPLTLVVPFPAGGSTDILGRALGLSLASQLGQPVVVENKAGAGGTIGASQVLRAPADGYTLLLGTPADQVNSAFLLAKPPYNPGRDFEPVGCIVRYANLLVVNPKLDAKNVQELVQLAKAKPGQINFGSAGNGNTSHLSGELFGQVAGVNITHVPYRGNAPAITDTIGGQVQMMFSGIASVLPHIKSGALRPLAMTGKTRSPSLPDVPTLRESGVPVDIYSWACLMVAAGTPANVMDKLNTALARALDDASVKQIIDTSGGERIQFTRDEARRYISEERRTWGELIRARNITAN